MSIEEKIEKFRQNIKKENPKLYAKFQAKQAKFQARFKEIKLKHPEYTRAQIINEINNTKPPQKRKSSKKMMISVQDLMDSPPPKKILWKQWSQSLSEKECEIIALMRGPIAQEFKKHDWILEFVVQPVNDLKQIWGDYGMDLLIDKYGYDVLEKPYLIFELCLDVNTQKFIPFLPLYMQHHANQEMMQVLKKTFVSNAMWDGSRQDAILLK